MHTRPGWEAKTILEIDVPVYLSRASLMTPKLTFVEVDMTIQDVVNWVLWLITENIMSAQVGRVLSNYTI